jgi:glycosyltransferase involved in cell wall biosynthesis
MLRVAIDGRSLQERPVGGVGRSLTNLLPHLAEHAVLDVLADDRRPPPRGVPPGLQVHMLRAPLSGRGAAWLQLAAPRWLRHYPRLFHCPFYGLPYRRPVPMVVTIHDLTFEFAPSWFTLERRFTFRRQARWAARVARRILTVSEHVRSMIIDSYARYGVAPERVIVTRWAVDPCFRPEPDAWPETLDRLALRQPYVVTLGGATRRQLGVAIAAWDGARRRIGASPDELPLVVVGSEAPVPRPGVVYAGVLDDRDWAAVLAGSKAFCFATRYEGYGMPAVEAAASGVPVVCARVGALPEVLEDAAAWCDEPNADSLETSLAAVLGDADRARSLRSAGLERARSIPTWTEVAAETLRAYREAVET